MTSPPPSRRPPAHSAGRLEGRRGQPARIFQQGHLLSLGLRGDGVAVATREGPRRGAVPGGAPRSPGGPVSPPAAGPRSPTRYAGRASTVSPRRLASVGRASHRSRRALALHDGCSPHERTPSRAYPREAAARCGGRRRRDRAAGTSRARAWPAGACRGEREPGPLRVSEDQSNWVAALAPRTAASVRPMSSGSGASTTRRSPVAGWASSTREAWSGVRSMRTAPEASRSGSGSP